MRHAAVPVTLGSPWFRTVETAWCRATEARFSAGDVLPAHTHDRPIVAVMLSGSFETAIEGRRFDCSPDSAWTEPCEVRHANYIGPMGARVLVMQPDPNRPELYESIASAIAQVALVKDPTIGVDARRMLGEMDHPDALSPLAMDALMLGILVRASRGRQERLRGRAPEWLGRVRELLHDEFRSPPSMSQLALVAGVTSTHLCHVFKEHTGTTVGEYVRNLRASWAAEQLRRTDAPLSAIALSAGYCDQSHFTREFRRLLGARPAEYRRNGGVGT